MSKIGRINLLAIIASLFAVSCTTTEEEGPSKDSRAISFTPNTMSRAAVDNADGMAAFSVWGWCSKDQSTSQIFTGKRVYKENENWTYQGIQYWLSGYTYDFYAVYPEFPTEGTEGQTTVTVAPDGTITINNFDCSATGDAARDLMTASNTGISYVSGEPAPVSLQFSHELSRLKFTVKSENTVATITSFKVYGVNYKGTLTKKETAKWSNMTPCTETATPFQLSNFTFNTTNGFEKNIFGDVLLIPNTDLTGATVAIAYRYPGETKDRTSSIFLKNSTPSGWIAGKSYHYTLTIKGGSLSVSVKVVDWKEEDTSVSWG